MYCTLYVNGTSMFVSVHVFMYGDSFYHMHHYYILLCKEGKGLVTNIKAAYRKWKCYTWKIDKAVTLLFHRQITHYKLSLKHLWGQILCSAVVDPKVYNMAQQIAAWQVIHQTS